MNLVTLPHPNKFLVVEPLNYPNPYDFTTAHRHDYFEIILIQESGGAQQIDFTKTALEANTVYVVYPRQIHLLKRTTAQGLILQFRKDIFEFIFPVKHHALYFTKPDLQLDAEKFGHLYNITCRIHDLNSSAQLSPLSIYKSYSYLQILLITLIEQQQALRSNSGFAGQFLQLVSQHVYDKKKVADYAEMMTISTDRLTAQCKESLNTTPLKIIHEELLLEIKRLMILEKLSLKEIAYELNFESTANFSAFVKSATGHTPSDLQHQLKYSL